MNSYFRVRFHSLSEMNEDILTTLSLEYGATGVSEVLEFSQPNLTFDARVMKQKSHDIDVYFPEKPTQDFFEAVQKLDSQISWSTFEEPHQDWLEEWKKGFKSFPLTSQVWVVPSWLEKPAEAKMQILIDPGMAFGTGTHATTQMAAHLISKFAEKNPELTKKAHMIDVGTGTGILAMLAQLLGFKKVTAIDVDPESRRVSRDNIKLNKLETIQITDQLIEEVRETYDVVMANIIDGVLVQIRDDLLKALKPDGHLFVTGILVERESYFFTDFIEKGNLQVIRRLESDEWIGFWLKRNSH